MSTPEKSNIWRERGNQPEKYMRDPIEDRAKKALQKAHKTVEGGLSKSEYETWRENNSEKRPPKPSTIVHEFNTWGNACNHANIPPENILWSRYDSIVALKQADQSISVEITITKYRNWVNKQPDPKPSVHKIEKLTGSWRLAKLIYTQTDINQSKQ